MELTCLSEQPDRKYYLVQLAFGAGSEARAFSSCHGGMLNVGGPIEVISGGGTCESALTRMAEIGECRVSNRR